MRTALTIAGSDSSGGAGIQADLKTFAANGVYGTSAVTAVTTQNTLGVSDVFLLPASVVVSQIVAVVEDFRPEATKIGMLGSAAIADAVAEVLRARRLPHIVLDTVLTSTSGAALLDVRGVEVLRTSLLPLAEVVTMNTREAEVLTGVEVGSVSDGQAAARRLHSLGARAVVVKGGHLSGPATDLLFDGRTFIELRADRIDTRHTHGTGCTFAAAIAARLALGDALVAAVRAAKSYVTRAIAEAPGLGHGRGPLAHFHS